MAKALEESDHDEIMRLVNFTLIHDMGRWQWHYPLHLIRQHVWKEAGKTAEEMKSLPGFFDIAYKPSPFLKAVTKLPIFGDKAELAQFDGAHLLPKSISAGQIVTKLAISRFGRVSRPLLRPFRSRLFALRRRGGVGYQYRNRQARRTGCAPRDNQT